MSLDIFLMTTFVGIALIALWTHVRFPTLAPTGPRLVIMHLVLAGAMAHGVAMTINAALPSTTLVVVSFFGAGFPALVYMFLSIIWLFGFLQGLMRGALR